MLSASWLERGTFLHRWSSSNRFSWDQHLHCAIWTLNLQNHECNKSLSYKMIPPQLTNIWENLGRKQKQAYAHSSYYSFILWPHRNLMYAMASIIQKCDSWVWEDLMTTFGRMKKCSVPECCVQRITGIVNSWFPFLLDNNRWFTHCLINSFSREGASHSAQCLWW